MAAKRLNANQTDFLKLYTGKSKLRGNATRCYMAIYGQMSDTVANASSSKLLANPLIQKALDRADQAAHKQLAINAEYVLSQSVRLLDRAMGDESIMTIHTEKDENGVEHDRVLESQDYDPKTAKAALQLIGQHKDVQAFTINVEHTHTMKLEQRLAARSKIIEGKAQRLRDSDDTAGITVVNDINDGLLNDNDNLLNDNSITVNQAVPESQKRVHKTPQSQSGQRAQQTSSEASGQRPNVYIPQSSNSPDIAPYDSSPENVLDSTEMAVDMAPQSFLPKNIGDSEESIGDDDCGVSVEKKFLGDEKASDRVIKRRNRHKKGDAFVRKYSGKPTKALGV